MTEKARAELLADVLSRYEDSPNPRLREITEAAIRHLHAFAAEVNLQRDEWFTGIQFLTATGQKCDDNRQEFILLSDTLGVSSLVEMLTHDGVEGSTENTVLGPFYVSGSPQRAKGESMLVDPDEGDRVVIRGIVTDIDHQPIAGATLDCWQNATAGFYAVQQPGEQSVENLRGIYTTEADGSYEIRTVRPVPYPIPSDGPARIQFRPWALSRSPATRTCGFGPTVTRSSSRTCSTRSPTTCARTRCSACVTA